MRSRKTRKKFGGLDIIGDVKGTVTTVLHPEKAFKHLIDRKIHQRIVTWVKTQIDPNNKDPELAALKIANKMFAKSKEKINEGIDKIYYKYKTQGRVSIDYARVALIDAIPIPEVPEVINDIVDVLEEVGMTADTAISEVEVANNIRQAFSMGPGLLSSMKSQVMSEFSKAKSMATNAKQSITKKGGRRNRKRMTKKYIIARRMSRRKARRSRRR
jgi:hypothetical protein